MWQAVGFLVGGYAFIALSYAWVWVIGAAISRDLTAQRFGRPSRTDLRAIGRMMAFWTAAYGFVAIVESLR